MSITKVLSDKDASSEEKLSSVAETVAVARKSYGNESEKVESPKVHTTNGEMSFVHLDDDSKVVLLQSEVARIKSQAVEFVEHTPGASFNKKIEELLATNGMFTNVAAGTKFAYI